MKPCTFFYQKVIKII